MARIKSFFGSDLKTGALIIGYVSLFANILYLILDIEAVLVFVLKQDNEKRELFGAYINEINESSAAFPIVLVALVASLYGVIASLMLICASHTATRKRVLWWLIYQPIAILSILAIGIYSIVVRANATKPFFDCAILESIFIIFLVALLGYVALHIYFFIVIIEFYLELKAQEPVTVVEDVETAVVKEEELQLLESPKAADETDQAEASKEEATEEGKAKEEEAKEEAAAAKSSKIRCPELPKCPSLKCPSWGNCVGPDNFE